MLSYLFPKTCYLCKKKGDYLCYSCQKRILPKRYQICPICKKITRNGRIHSLCKKKTNLEGTISCYDYKFPLKSLLKDFKYRQIRDLRETIVNLVVKSLKRQVVLSYWRENDFVFTPVPLFPVKRLWRGFNQSELILEKICQKLSLGFDNKILFRKRWTRDQASLLAKKRRKNIEGSFETKKDLRTKNVVIFDDVATTLSTLNESAKALKESGVEEIWGLTILS